MSTFILLIWSAIFSLGEQEIATWLDIPSRHFANWSGGGGLKFLGTSTVKWPYWVTELEPKILIAVIAFDKVYKV